MKKCDCCGWKEIDVEPVTIRGVTQNLCGVCRRLD